MPTFEIWQTILFMTRGIERNNLTHILSNPDHFYIFTPVQGFQKVNRSKNGDKRRKKRPIYLANETSDKDGPVDIFVPYDLRILLKTI